MEDAYLGQAKDVILGQDFLTWLWYKSEAKNGMFSMPDNEAFTLFVEQRVSVQGGEGDSKETTSVSGLMSELKEAKLGLAMGKKVNKAQIHVDVDSEEWRFTLRAEDFAINGFKTPKVEVHKEEDEDPDGAFLEKMYLIERGLGFLGQLFEEFLQLRLSKEWADECHDIAVWLEQD